MVKSWTLVIYSRQTFVAISAVHDHARSGCLLLRLGRRRWRGASFRMKRTSFARRYLVVR
jgi:hypothetical protein